MILPLKLSIFTLERPSAYTGNIVTVLFTSKFKHKHRKSTEEKINHFEQRRMKIGTGYWSVGSDKQR